MKFFITSLIIIMTFNVNAGETGQDVTKACLQQAVSLVQQLKAGVFPDMDESQSNEVLRLATGNCKKYFNNSNQVKVSKGSDSADNTTGISEDQSGDWFTNYILNGEASDKEGNRRLKRMQHK